MSGINGQISLPSGLAIDKKGNIYTTDSYNSYIFVFDPYGKLIRKWGGWGYENGQFGSPIGIAVSEGGYVYVTDIEYHCIKKFTIDGRFVAKWGKIDDSGHTESGSEDGQFNWPIDVTVDENENIYVADTNNNRIQKLDSGGKFLMKINCFHKNFLGENVPESPKGIAVDERGYIYISTNSLDSYSIKRYDANGTLAAEFEGHGAGYGRFYPEKVAIDKGYLYITDDRRIQKFDTNGNFIVEWGSTSSDTGKFMGPYGIAADRNGYVYVVDSYNCRVQKFDPSGNFIISWGKYDHTDGNFDLPTGIAIDKSGDICIRDAGIHARDNGFMISRIQKFDSNGNFISGWESPDQLIHDDIAFGSDGLLYVAGQDKTIFAFTSDGILKKQWKAGSDDNYSPSGEIATDSNGNIYIYEDNGAYWRIQKYDLDGNLIKTLINPETGDVHFFLKDQLPVTAIAIVFLQLVLKVLFPTS